MNDRPLQWFLMTGLLEANDVPRSENPRVMIAALAPSETVAVGAFRTLLLVSSNLSPLRQFDTYVVTARKVELDEVDEGTKLFHLAITNDEEPFRPLEIIKFADEEYVVLQNHGGSGVVKYNHEDDADTFPFRWHFEGEDCVRLFPTLKFVDYAPAKPKPNEVFTLPSGEVAHDPAMAAEAWAKAFYDARDCLTDLRELVEMISDDKCLGERAGDRDIKGVLTRAGELINLGEV